MKCYKITACLFFLFVINLPFSITESDAVCLDPPSGMVSWWPGDGNTNDIIGPNDAILFNETTFAAGKVDQAFSFDGVDDYAWSPGANIDNLQQLTIDAWVRHDSLSTSRSQWYVYLSQKAMLRMEGAEGNTRLHFLVTIDGVNRSIRVNNVLQVGVFHHVAGTYDGSFMRLYLDGVELSSLAVSGTVAAGDGIVLGSHDRSLDGLLDEVEIYSRALSTSEIQAIFNAGSEGKCKPTGDPGYALDAASVRYYKNENGSKYNALYFEVVDDQGDHITDGNIVTDVKLYKPNQNLVNMETVTFDSPYEYLGGQFELDTDQFTYNPSIQISGFGAKILEPLNPGTYQLVVTTVDGQLPAEEITVNENIELPCVTHHSFQINPDSYGNIFWMWDISEKLLSMADSTQIRASVGAYLNDQLEFLIYVRLPTHMGFVFIPDTVVQQLPSGTYKYQYQIQVRTLDGNNRAYSKSVFVDDPLTTVLEKRQVAVVPLF